MAERDIQSAARPALTGPANVPTAADCSEGRVGWEGPKAGKTDATGAPRGPETGFAQFPGQFT